MVEFKKSHGGREKYFECKFKNQLPGDCTTRAMAHVTGEDYMLLFKEQFRLGLEIGTMPNDDKIVDIMMTARGWVKHSPMKIGNSNRKHILGKVPVSKSKSYLFRLSGHVTAIVNGVMLDTYDCRPWAAQSYYTKS